MKNKLLELIKGEDLRNPYTDDMIANALGIRRDRVTLLRKELGVPDSRERRKPTLLADMRDILNQEPNISNTELTNMLLARGYQLSRFVVSQTREQLASESDLPALREKPEICAEKKDEPSITGSAFEKVIGARGSLKRQIKLAKAAVLYPPYGLHILICGASGVGKSSLVTAIHKFGVESGKFSNDAPLIVFNCADYADNPQLLMSQLFGHAKGAFTGALSAKSGLVEQANRGILFLDEVHRLPPEGQEMLYYLIDTGRFRRLGDTEAVRQASVMIIAATTENIESALLLTFRRRIPMIIDLPRLSERPIQERYEMICRFVSEEANRVGMTIRVTRDATRALMLYDCPGNVGQLRSDIQVACARGYLSHFGETSESMCVGLLELPFRVDSKMLLGCRNNATLITLTHDDLVVDNSANGAASRQNGRKNPFHGDIYQYLEERIEELQRQNVPTETINAILSEETKRRFSQFLSYSERQSQSVSFDEICRKFSASTLESIYLIRDVLERRSYQDSDYLYYCIGMHLEATIKRLEQGRIVYNPHLPEIQERYPYEYDIALEITRVLSNRWGYMFPEDEAGYLAMYLQLNRTQLAQDEHVGIVIVAHGKLASSILEVVQYMTPDQTSIAAVDMPLDEKTSDVFANIIAAVRQVSTGRGVALLVDMGSLTHIGREIADASGVPICIVERVETVMVLQALEKAASGASLEEVCAAAGKTSSIYTLQTQQGKKKAIVTVCVTGLGAAITFKEMIESALDTETANTIEVLPIGYLNDQGLNEQIRAYQKDYDIMAIAGTIRPNFPEIPFITIRDLIGGGGLAGLLRGLMSNDAAQSTHAAAFDEWKPLDVFRKECVIVYEETCHKAMIIEQLCSLLQDAGCVNEQYILDVYRREMNGPTIYRNGVAIPHGMIENVLCPAVAVAVLPAPIEWMPEFTADKIFLLALPEDGHEVMTRLRRMFDNKQLMAQISELRNPETIRDILTEHMLLNI